MCLSDLRAQPALVLLAPCACVSLRRQSRGPHFPVPFRVLSCVFACFVLVCVRVYRRPREQLKWRASLHDSLTSELSAMTSDSAPPEYSICAVSPIRSTSGKVVSDAVIVLTHLQFTSHSHLSEWTRGVPAAQSASVYGDADHADDASKGLRGHVYALHFYAYQSETEKLVAVRPCSLLALADGGSSGSRKDALTLLPPPVDADGACNAVLMTGNGVVAVGFHSANRSASAAGAHDGPGAAHGGGSRCMAIAATAAPEPGAADVTHVAWSFVGLSDSGARQCLGFGLALEDVFDATGSTAQQQQNLTVYALGTSSFARLPLGTVGRLFLAEQVVKDRRTGVSTPGPVGADESLALGRSGFGGSAVGAAASPFVPSASSASAVFGTTTQSGVQLPPARFLDESVGIGGGSTPGLGVGTGTAGAHVADTSSLLPFGVGPIPVVDVSIAHRLTMQVVCASYCEPELHSVFRAPCYCWYCCCYYYYCYCCCYCCCCCRCCCFDCPWHWLPLMWLRPTLLLVLLCCLLLTAFTAGMHRWAVSELQPTR